MVTNPAVDLSDLSCIRCGDNGDLMHDEGDGPDQVFHDADL